MPCLNWLKSSSALLMAASRILLKQKMIIKAVSFGNVDLQRAYGFNSPNGKENEDEERPSPRAADGRSSSVSG